MITSHLFLSSTPFNTDTTKPVESGNQQVCRVLEHSAGIQSAQRKLTYKPSPRPKLKSKGPSQQMITDHLLLCTTHNLVLGRPNAARNPSNLARQRYVSLALFFYLARSATCTAFVTILI